MCIAQSDQDGRMGGEQGRREGVGGGGWAAGVSTATHTRAKGDMHGFLGIL